MSPEGPDRLFTIQEAVREYLAGIEQTGQVFALGALHLAASPIDVLARLTIDAKNDLARYQGFVEEYFPQEYTDGALPPRLYQGLRNLGLHNLSVGRSLALVAGQDCSAHLRIDTKGRTITRLQEFLEDLRSAVMSWEHSLQQGEALRSRVVERERRKPVFEVLMIFVPEGQAVVSTTVAASATTHPIR